MSFITLNNAATYARQRPVRIRTTNIESITLPPPYQTDTGSRVQLTSVHLVSGSLTVTESPEEIEALITQAEGSDLTLDMARLLRASWSPTMELTGHLTLEAVAEFLGRTPKEVVATYNRAITLATGATK
jgi:hypothetical protein